MDTKRLIVGYKSQLPALRMVNTTLLVTQAQNQVKIDYLKAKVKDSETALLSEERRYNALRDDFEIKKQLNPIQVPLILEEEIIEETIIETAQV